MSVVHLQALFGGAGICDGGAQSPFLRDVSCAKCLSRFAAQTLPKKLRLPTLEMSVYEEGRLIERQYARLHNPQQKTNPRLQTLRAQLAER